MTMWTSNSAIFVFWWIVDFDALQKNQSVKCTVTSRDECLSVRLCTINVFVNHLVVSRDPTKIPIGLWPRYLARAAKNKNALHRVVQHAHAVLIGNGDGF